jgi:hypothetical protein
MLSSDASALHTRQQATAAPRLQPEQHPCPMPALSVAVFSLCHMNLTPCPATSTDLVMLPVTWNSAQLQVPGPAGAADGLPVCQHSAHHAAENGKGEGGGKRHGSGAWFSFRAEEAAACLSMGPRMSGQLVMRSAVDHISGANLVDHSDMCTVITHPSAGSAADSALHAAQSCRCAVHVGPLLVLRRLAATPWQTSSNATSEAGERSCTLACRHATACTAAPQILIKALPLMIGWFALNLPSGLGLYYLSNTVLTTGQQLFLRKYSGARCRQCRPVLLHGCIVACTSDTIWRGRTVPRC